MMCEQPGSQQQPQQQQQQPPQQENGNNGQQQTCANCGAQSGNNYPQYHQTYVVPASQPNIERDFYHRSVVTIQSQQRQWPQDIWFHSPTQRVLYHPTLAWDNNMPVDLPQDEDFIPPTEPSTRGNETNGSST
ncbi:hypothetical protein NXS19_005931 [Fusarium pseudograminearum]|nr:hypothetical protein NXS19_005931 [Fusarium pseudograminearum]